MDEQPNPLVTDSVATASGSCILVNISPVEEESHNKLPTTKPPPLLKSSSSPGKMVTSYDLSV